LDSVKSASGRPSRSRSREIRVSSLGSSRQLVRFENMGEMLFEDSAWKSREWLGLLRFPSLLHTDV